MRTLILLWIFFPVPAWAHGTDGPRSWDELGSQWGKAPFAVLLLVFSGWLYARGWHRLRRVSPHAVRWDRTAFFALGWVVLFLSIASPLHPWGEVLFSVHMIQHELLMLVAAPLLVLSHPIPVFLWALPRSGARTIARMSAWPAWRKWTVTLGNPLVAWAVHAAVLWGWHAPALFQAATEYEPIHALQHASFFGSALLFWWALFRGHQRAPGYGAALLYLFTTAIHTGLLGALLTFSRTIWYPIYGATTAPWNLTPLQDQQLGGLIMWIPAGLVYVATGLALFAAWLRESELRSGQRPPMREVRLP